MMTTRTLTSLVLVLMLASLVLVLMLAVAGLFAAVQYSDAQETTVCPADTTLSADGTKCLSNAVDDNVTTTTSCLQGVLSEDGKACIVPRLDAAPGPRAAAPVEAPIPTFTG